MTRWIGGLIAVVGVTGGIIALRSYVYNSRSATTAASYKDTEYIIDGMRVKLTNGVIGGIIALRSYVDNTRSATTASYKDAEYIIDGMRVKLTNGVAQTRAAPGSASQIVTRHVGNELKTDLDGDGADDVVFLVTQERGGSGTSFYAVAAVHTDSGYVGSDGYLLGDRIAPQSTRESPNPRHRYVVVVTYSDRAPDEPMTARPSVTRSVYLKLDAERMRWGIVEPDFEGESR